MSTLGTSRSPDMAMTWTAGKLGSTDTAPPQGVQLIHVIPDGVACVRDQIARDAPPNDELTAVIADAYKDEALAQEWRRMAEHVIEDYKEQD